MTISAHKNILLIQTSLLANNSLEKALSNEKYKVYKTFHANSIDPQLLSIGFDCILIDVLMPEITGFDILESIHKTISSPCPVIMLSFIAHPSAAKEALKKGASGYYVKPIEPQELLSNIDYLVHEFNKKKMLSNS